MSLAAKSIEQASKFSACEFKLARHYLWLYECVLSGKWHSSRTFPILVKYLFTKMNSNMEVVAYAQKG